MLTCEVTVPLDLMVLLADFLILVLLTVVMLTECMYMFASLPLFLLNLLITLILAVCPT